MADHKRYEAGNPDVEGEVPAEVAGFLSRLNKALAGKDVSGASRLYESELPQLTDQFYSNHHHHHHHHNRGTRQPSRHWPAPRFVKKIFTSSASEALYTIHYFRSVFSDRTVSAAARKQSWDAFQTVFSELTSESINIDVPNGWLWDVVDEFIYQMQMNKIRKLRANETPVQNIWSVGEVIERLKDVVARSGVIKMLEALAKGTAPTVFFQGADAASHVRNVLGYSALVGLVRIRVLLGDYVGAMESAEPLGLRTFGPALSTKIPPVHTSIYYHIGFAYMMMRRYADATATLQQALCVKASTRKFLEALQSHVISLIAVTCTLGDIPLQDFSGLVSERHRSNQDDDLNLLAQGDVERFREVFIRACPKFVSPADASTTQSQYAESGQEARELQLRMFLREVRQQVDVLKLRGYLRAYSTVTTAKVDQLLGTQETGTCAEAHLIAMKHKSRQLNRAGGGLLSGDFSAPGVLHFTADRGSIGVQRNTEETSCCAAFYDRLKALDRAA